MIQLNPMTDMPIDLKPCPFCGGEAKLVHDKRGHARPTWYVLCPPCDLIRDQAFGCATQEEAVTAWNTRAPDPALKECVEALEAVRALAYDDHWGNAKVDCQIIDLIDATLAAMTKGEE